MWVKPKAPCVNAKKGKEKTPLFVRKKRALFSAAFSLPKTPGVLQGTIPKNGAYTQSHPTNGFNFSGWWLPSLNGPGEIVNAIRQGFHRFHEFAFWFHF